MAWATPELDLRRTLNDGPTDKLRHRKAVFGQVNGTNDIFKTLEFRRLTDFTAPAVPEGVYVNNVQVAVGDDNPEVGEFVVAQAPVEGDIIQATYYIQYFLDSELVGFLSDANEWLGFGDDYTNVNPGLRPAALQYGAYLGYQKLAMRFHENLSETFRLEDAPASKNIEYLTWLNSMADGFLKRATGLRKNFYERNDQASAPLYSVASGRVPRNVPNR
jgi:hypothetical protein